MEALWSCNACGTCCNEKEMVAVDMLSAGLFRRFYNDGSSDFLYRLITTDTEIDNDGHVIGTVVNRPKEDEDSCEKRLVALVDIGDGLLRRFYNDGSTNVIDNENKPSSAYPNIAHEVEMVDPDEYVQGE